MTRVVLALLLQAPVSQGPATFESGVSAVHLDVSVRRNGQPVPGLAAADFQVTDEGSRRQVEVVEGANAPVHAILVMDLSASVHGERLEALRSAAQAFLDGLGPRDRATLVTISPPVRLATPVSVTPAEAHRALAAAPSQGGTALFDGIFAAVALADRRHGRPIVLVFSDGRDEHSWLSEERLRELVREGEGVIHAVASTTWPAHRRPNLLAELDDIGQRNREGMGLSESQRVFDAWAQAGPARGARIPAVLTALADETGGSVWRAEKDADLSQAFAAALADVRSRYLLRFEPAPGQRGDWHDVQVRVRAPADVRARKGYRVR